MSYMNIARKRLIELIMDCLICNTSLQTEIKLAKIWCFFTQGGWTQIVIIYRSKLLIYWKRMFSCRTVLWEVWVFVMWKILLDSMFIHAYLRHLYISTICHLHLSNCNVQESCCSKMLHILWNDSQNVSWMIIFVCLFVYISLEIFLRKWTLLHYWWSSSYFYLYSALTAPELCKLCGITCSGTKQLFLAHLAF